MEEFAFALKDEKEGFAGDISSILGAKTHSVRRH